MKRNRKPGSGAPAPAPADGSRNGDGASAWAGATLGSHGLGAAAAGAAGGKAVEACTSARVSDSSTSLKSSWGGTGHGASELPAVWPGARDSSHAACLDHCHVGHVLLHLRCPRLLWTLDQLTLEPAGQPRASVDKAGQSAHTQASTCLENCVFRARMWLSSRARRCVGVPFCVGQSRSSARRRGAGATQLELPARREQARAWPAAAGRFMELQLLPALVCTRAGQEAATQRAGRGTHKCLQKWSGPHFHAATAGI